MTNEVTNLLKSHRSIRRYTDEPIPDEILQDILTCGQWAPSSHNVQAYSIIVVKNPEIKEQLSEVCRSQIWVKTCPVFLVFCVDFFRHKLVSEMHSSNFEIKEVENVLVGAVDTALVLQNVLIAARSYGLSGVPMGGIRLNPTKVVELLDLPELTIPLIGLCLGYPADEPWQKPRLPQRIVVHNETYQKDKVPSGLEEYESISADYYTRRTNGERTTGWTKQTAEYLSKPRYTHMKSFIQKQGFELR